ncbi:hypothetical protein [Promicromonospora sp. AC04]|uniref:hypothetical protein n=1 Tax=Promicromonospora sp. AC04 TaxID=2135723 RepID=UPI001304E68C|nr:hypothetical protein [Promicromonospora sp. AC04]
MSLFHFSLTGVLGALERAASGSFPVPSLEESYGLAKHGSDLDFEPVDDSGPQRVSGDEHPMIQREVAPDGPSDLLALGEVRRMQADAVTGEGDQLDPTHADVRHQTRGHGERVTDRCSGVCAGVRVERVQRDHRPFLPRLRGAV